MESPKAYDIPTANQSIKSRVERGKMTLREAAREMRINSGGEPYKPEDAYAMLRKTEDWIPEDGRGYEAAAKRIDRTYDMIPKIQDALALGEEDSIGGIIDDFNSRWTLRGWKEIIYDRCKCGNAIPYDPSRRHQHHFCGECRSRFGGNRQRHNQKAAARKRKEGRL